MNIEKILAEAPEGATHWGEHVDYLMLNSALQWFRHDPEMLDGNEWYSADDYRLEWLESAHCLSDLHELQKLRAENEELRTKLRNEKPWYEGDYLKESQEAKGDL